MQRIWTSEPGSVETVTVDGVPQIRLAGECDISTMPVLEKHLQALVLDGPKPIVFNLEAATFLDSSILRIFLGARRGTGGAGREVVLLCRPGFVRRLLFLLEMDRLMRICTPEEWRDRVKTIN